MHATQRKLIDAIVDAAHAAINLEEEVLYQGRKLVVLGEDFNARYDQWIAANTALRDAEYEDFLRRLHERELESAEDVDEDGHYYV